MVPSDAHLPEDAGDPGNYAGKYTLMLVFLATGEEEGKSPGNRGKTGGGAWGGEGRAVERGG